MKLYSNITKIFLLWIGAVLLISYFGFYILPHSGKFNSDFWGSLGNWDGGHFLGIAQKGYSEKFQYAFFPLYPLAIRLVNFLTQNYLFSGLLISIGSAFFGVQLLYRLVLEDFEKKIAEKTVMALLFFPTSFFFLTAYSEGLFFLLTISAFYFLKKNKLFWAVVAAALASATRLVGLAVVLAILIDIGTREGFNKKNWHIFLLPFAGFLFYCMYLYKVSGDPFYFITAENHWQRTIVTPGIAFWETLRSVPNGMIDLLFAIFGVGFAIRSLRFLPASLAVYSLLSVLIPLFTSTLSSMPRFLLPVFPIFITVALIKKPMIALGIQIFSIMLLGVFTVLFIAGFFVS